MIEVEGNIHNQLIANLIDYRYIHFYINPKIVERFKLKRKITKLVKDFPVSMNGVSSKADLNIIPLGSYDFLIGMD
jgi:hypothetical protein